VEITRPVAGSQLRSRLRQVLLAMLLAHRGEVVSVSKLAATLWPAGPPPKASKGLQIHVHRLRQALGDPAAVRFHPPGYRLVVPADSVDIYRFEELGRLGYAALAQGDPAGAAGQLRDALALCRGPAFQGLDDIEDLAVESTRLAEVRLGILEHRIAAELALGQHAGLIAELEALVTEHPLREKFRAQLMVALYRSGRKADALAAYRSGRKIMVAELGIEPNEECRALERAILTDDPALARPEPAAGGPGRPAPAKPPVPRQLPPDVAGFTGRTDHLRWLDGLLPGPGAAPAAAVVSAVDGTAGVGKTALVVHWAHRVAGRFPDGQLYLDLRGYAPGQAVRPVEALTWFLRALEAEPGPPPTELDEAVARYRSRLADRRVLVVLDNAASADQVRPLLPGGGGCLVVVTSRHQLPGLVAREGARRLELDVFTPAEAVALLTSLLGPDRVRAESAAAAQLAELCGHLPLALRIVAATLILHPAQRIAEVVTRLRGADWLSTLEVPGDRRATVAAAFDDSYQRLPEPERRMFRLTGLVPGPEITVAAAAALAGSTVAEAARRLRGLVDAHLLAEPATGRYTGHDLLRRYAAEQAIAGLAEADRAAAIGRLYEYYLAHTDGAVRMLLPGVLRLPDAATAAGPEQCFTDPAAALAWLEAERANLTAAVVHAAGTGSLRPLAWQLADPLRAFLASGGYPVEAMAVAEAWLAAAEAERQPFPRAGAVLGIANVHFQQGNYPSVVRYATEGGTLLRETSWLAGQGVARNLLGAVAANTGHADQAIAHYLAALARFEQAGWRNGQAAVVSNLSVLLYNRGDLVRAAEYARRAEAVFVDLKSVASHAAALTDLGNIYQVWGELDRALDSFARARDRAREAGSSAEAEAVLGMAAVHLDAGRLAEARELAGVALELADRAGDQRYQPDCLSTLAAVHRELGEPGDAARCYRRALEVARLIGDPGGEAQALMGLASVRPPPDGYPTARERAAQALAITREFDYRILAAEALRRLAEIELADGDPEQAIRTGEEALAGHRALGYRIEEARTMRLLGHAREALGDPAAARDDWRRAYEIFSALRLPEAGDLAAVLARQVATTPSD
jgi:DNA-binding SARP family transcriptional activator